MNNYEHQEIEANGEVATNFENDIWELRTELVHKGDRLAGAFGFQHTKREFSAVGEEAFIAPVDTKDSGVFWVGEYAFDNFDLEGGVRVNRLTHEPSAGRDETFTDVSTSLGIVLQPTDELQIGIVTDYSSRAPIAEELYSNGPHLTTNAFEVGNPNLDSEKAINLAGTLRYNAETWGLKFTTYYTQFSDFIYEQATGAEEDGLPVFAFQQDDADFFGVDLEVNAQLATFDLGGRDARLDATFGIDYVQAELDVSGNDNIPRLPPMRQQIGLSLTAGNFVAGVSYKNVRRQTNNAPNEFDTGGYEDYSAHAQYTFAVADNSTLAVFVKGKNLTDDEQRHHTSFIKDAAPAPGRTIEAGIRLNFN